MNIIAHIKNLRLKFPKSNRMQFKDFTLSINRGEKVLILGPSGCGKSTLLHVLSGLMPHSVEVPMQTDNFIVPSSWGYVFQDPDTQFCMPHVDEEIAFALENMQIAREEMPARINQLLGLVNLEFDNSHVDIHGLSGGMKQRLAIASTLALDPEVLFLDEPTAMLDPDGTEEVWEVVRRVAHDKTLIIVEHKLDYVIDLVDRIILLNAIGEIVADGTKDHIFQDHLEEVQKSGIWYKGAWEDYLGKHQARFQNEVISSQKSVILTNFKGYLKEKIKLEIPYLEINSGEWVAITGENGAGKTTLLYALMQLIKTSGSYTLNDTPIANMSELTGQGTIIFQNPEYQFLTNSVYDEVAYSLRLSNMCEDEIERKVEALLHRFRLINHKKNHPYQLSMGQKRVLSVAASLVKPIPLLLLDEPTFGLDARSTFCLLDLLEQCRKDGMTILMSTHDRRLAKDVATRSLKIKKGCLVEDVLNRKESGTN